jgi:hypothetical protein
MKVLNAFFFTVLNFITVFLCFFLIATTLIPSFLFLFLFYALFGRRLFVLASLQTILLLLFFKNYFILFIHLNFPDLLIYNVLPLLFGMDFVSIAIATLVFITLRYIKISHVSLFVIILVMIFGSIGILNSSFTSFVMYSRFYCIPLIAIVFGLYFGKTEGFLESLVCVMLIYLIFILLEMFIPNYHSMLSINEFSIIKYYNNPSRALEMSDLVSRMSTTVAGYKINRLVGTQIHPISVGYSLLSIAVAIRLYSKSLFLLVSPLLIIGCMLSSKGAFAAILCIYASIVLYKLSLSKLIPLLLIVYAAVLLFIAMIPGLSSGYEHFLGLIGALENLPQRPLGLGIGAGGTMSVLKGPEFGGESGFGTIVSHIGIFAFLLYWFLFKTTWAMANKSRNILLCVVYINVLLINSFFQEEALAPSGVFIGWLLFGFCLLQTLGSPKDIIHYYRLRFKI